MNTKRIINIIAAAVCYVAFVIFTKAVMTYDLQPIAPDGSMVGFGSYNRRIFEQLGTNEMWYEITQVLGWLALLICAVFALIGLVQLIKGKSLAAVDPDIICMGVLYVLCIIAYVVFLKVTINVRPVLEDGVAEASYPSSHTVLAFCVFASLLIEIRRRITDSARAMIESIACAFFMSITIFGRLLSGMHWATDIIGGVILSMAFIFTFAAILPQRK
ncbi:MAG: phosphatase PAP2 family protein [Firmicutes bacterium]|nr:phosphatase PAP2 family protein [Bacillota bacterium]